MLGVVQPYNHLFLYHNGCLEVAIFVPAGSANLYHPGPFQEGLLYLSNDVTVVSIYCLLTYLLVDRVASFKVLKFPGLHCSGKPLGKPEIHYQSYGISYLKDTICDLI